MKTNSIVQPRFAFLFLYLFFAGGVVVAYGQSWIPLGSEGALSTLPHVAQMFLLGPLCVDDSNNIYVSNCFRDSIRDSHGPHSVYEWNVAKWSVANGEWTALGYGDSALRATDPINVLVADKYNNIYTAGDFADSNAGNVGLYNFLVEKWNGNTWDTLGTGNNALNANGSIHTLSIDDSCNVYAGGHFADSNGYQYVAKWNGSTWCELGNLHANSYINASCVDKNYHVYAGGIFTDSTGYPYIARYDPVSGNWQEMGGSFHLPGVESDIEIDELILDSAQNVYAGINYEGNSYVAVWNGSTWSALGGTTWNNQLMSMCIDDSQNIYAAGLFTDSLGMAFVAEYRPAAGYWVEMTYDNSLLNGPYIQPPKIESICVDHHGNVYADGPNADTNIGRQTFFYVAEFLNPHLSVQSISYQSEIEVFPNPAQWNINVTVTSQKLPKKYTITNVLGQVVATGDLRFSGNTSKINIKNLPSGLLLLEFDESKQFFKIIKND